MISSVVNNYKSLAEKKQLEIVNNTYRMAVIDLDKARKASTIMRRHQDAQQSARFRRLGLTRVGERVRDTDLFKRTGVPLNLLQRRGTPDISTVIPAPRIPDRVVKKITDEPKLRTQPDAQLNDIIDALEKLNPVSERVLDVRKETVIPETLSEEFFRKVPRIGGRGVRITRKR